MGKGGSDGCTDAARACRESPPRTPPEEPVRADFTNPEHVKAFLESFHAYVDAIEDQDEAGIRAANALKRPFNYCSNMPVNLPHKDNFPFMVNEFAYQAADKFIAFVNDYMMSMKAQENDSGEGSSEDGEDEPDAKKARTESEKAEDYLPEDFFTQAPPASPVSSLPMEPDSDEEARGD